MRKARCSFFLLPGLKIFFIFFFILFPSDIRAQNDIPIGMWRYHLSYNKIECIAIGNQQVFGASQNGIMVLDADYSIQTFNKLNGLTSAGISYIETDETMNRLLVAYDDGNLDVITQNEVINFDRLKNSDAVTGSKKINHVIFKNTIAYLSTDYGVVVFDMARNEVRETWRDLSSTGANLKINQGAISGDSIFLATAKGILAGNLNDNLLDFNNWKRYDGGSFAGNIPFISLFNNRIYAAVNNAGVFYKEGNQWINESFLQALVFTSMNASHDYLLITEEDHLWTIDQEDALMPITDDLISRPLFAREADNGKIWIADAVNGLVLYNNGMFEKFLPDGPENPTAQKLKYENGTIYSLPGGYSANFNPLNNDRGYDLFSAGHWSNHSSMVGDVTDIDFLSNKIYLASFGYGVEEDNGEEVQVYNENNSSLINTSSPGNGVKVTALARSSDGLWVTNYGASSSLHLLDNGQVWHSFSFPVVASRYPTGLLVDENDFVWMVLNPLQGGGILVFDMENNWSAYLTEQAGAGGLPSRAVYSIALDRDGYVWIGTDAGVAYFVDSYDIFSSAVDAIKPIFDNRFLLKSERITTIAVDGGNRKWMGTDNGVWLFNSTGEEMILNFTAENSALISNEVKDMAINSATGEIFFSTAKGIVSYREGSTVGLSSFNGIKIFPNPVTPSFNGTIGITGLTTDAFVKITDLNGKLIWQEQASGGTATWNLHDASGGRVKTGVYLVFAASEDASEKVVGKIAIIE